MTYKEYIESMVISSNHPNYNLLIKSVLQTDVAPSIYLTKQMSKQEVSRGLASIFGQLTDKNKNMSYNYYFYSKYTQDILQLDVTKVKKCSSCKQELSLENFYSNGYQPNGNKKYKSKCKKCQNKTLKERKIALLELLEIPCECVLCKYSKCKEALEFHHVDPDKKEYSISELRSHSKSTIVKELEKCILVCANCHREIHYGMHPEYLLS